MPHLKDIPAAKPRVKGITKKGMCFKCAKVKQLVAGHKVCGDCHNPVKCHTCNPNKGQKVVAGGKVS